MAAPSKTQQLNDIFNALKKRYKLTSRTEHSSVLEAVLYGICHENMTRDQANQALSRMKDEFFDWNEIRVSALRDIQSVFAGYPDPEQRARLTRRFLRRLFSRSYGFTLDLLQKKPQKEAIKALQEYEAVRSSDFVLATVIQRALGGHAIPIDANMRRALERLGTATPDMETEALRGALERAVPKNRGVEFCELMEELIHDPCVEEDPDCLRCVLNSTCPTGKAHLAAKPSPGETGKSKAKPSPSAATTTAAKPSTHANTKPAKAAPKAAAKADKSRRPKK